MLFKKVSCGVEICRLCEAGYYGSSTGLTQCQYCSRGTYSFQGASSCTNCVKGTYATGVAEIKCLICRPGSFSDVVGSPNCTGCSSGTYSTKFGADNITTCVECEQGKYSATPSSTFCTVCENGKYNLKVGAYSESACYSCDRGGYCYDGLIYDCPLYTNSSLGSRSIFECICEAGKVCRKITDYEIKLKTKRFTHIGKEDLRLAILLQTQAASVSVEIL